MAVFRIKKTRNHTFVSSFHLRDKRLSLKARGLLSEMLSMPDEWDYTLKGLTDINKEGIDAICEGVRELERTGYILREWVRNEKGQIKGTEYAVYEHPQTDSGELDQEETVQRKPTLKPGDEKPKYGDAYTGELCTIKH